MPNGSLRPIGRAIRKNGPGFTPAPQIDPEAEIIPDWKRTRDKIASRGDFAGRPMRSMKKGGKVKRTGPHMLHRGEKVVPAKKGKKPMPRGRK